MSRSRKKPQRRNVERPVKKPMRSSPSSPKLSPQQIAIIAALLNNFFVVESVLYNRNNELKVILTSNILTGLPLLGNPGFGIAEQDVALDIIESSNNPII